MHSIKKAARREAWYGSRDGEVKTYNFFGRVGTQRRLQDEETGSPLQHTATENEATSPVETRRKEGYHRDFPPPPRPGTFPTSGRNDDREFAPIEKERDPIASGSDNSIDGPSQEVRFDDQDDDGTVDRSAGPANGDSAKPRKRKLRKFMPWKKNDDDQTTADDEDEDDKKKNVKNPNITVKSQLRAVFFSWINILLVFVPIGLILKYVDGGKLVPYYVIFILNFVAIIPLAGMLAYATEELAMYIGEVMGGLLNATFGNAVELIVGIIALAKDEILIVQTSLIGSMLSNLLLVLGMCFFFGGIRRVEQFFNVTVAQTGASLLALATGSLVIPSALKIFGGPNYGVAPASRGCAVLLLLTYGCYLIFQLRTHKDIYNEPSQKAPKKPKKPSRRKSQGDAIKAMARMGGTSAGTAGGHVNQENLVQKNEEDEEEVPQLTKVGALVTLAGSTVLVAFCADAMVGSISELSNVISPEFIGLILLPIVGNAAEHATAVTVAIKDKMDLAIGVAVGSSLQIALLVLPLMVMFNWFGIGSKSYEPMTLSFDGFQIVVLFVAVLVVNYLIQDGKSHWLEGVMLQITYLLIAIAAFYYPVPKNEKLA